MPAIGVLAVCLAPAFPAWADEDEYKLYGRGPVYRGPGLQGVPLPPEEV